MIKHIYPSCGIHSVGGHLFQADEWESLNKSACFFQGMFEHHPRQIEMELGHGWQWMGAFYSQQAAPMILNLQPASTTQGVETCHFSWIHHL